MKEIKTKIILSIIFILGIATFLYAPDPEPFDQILERQAVRLGDAVGGSILDEARGWSDVDGLVELYVKALTEVCDSDFSDPKSQAFLANIFNSGKERAEAASDKFDPFYGLAQVAREKLMSQTSIDPENYRFKIRVVTASLILDIADLIPEAWGALFRATAGVERVILITSITDKLINDKFDGAIKDIIRGYEIALYGITSPQEVNQLVFVSNHLLREYGIVLRGHVKQTHIEEARVEVAAKYMNGHMEGLYKVMIQKSRGEIIDYEILASEFASAVMGAVENLHMTHAEEVTFRQRMMQEDAGFRVSYDLLPEKVQKDVLKTPADRFGFESLVMLRAAQRVSEMKFEASDLAWESFLLRFIDILERATREVDDLKSVASKIVGAYADFFAYLGEQGLAAELRLAIERVYKTQGNRVKLLSGALFGARMVRKLGTSPRESFAAEVVKGDAKGSGARAVTTRLENGHRIWFLGEQAEKGDTPEVRTEAKASLRKTLLKGLAQHFLHVIGRSKKR